MSSTSIRKITELIDKPKRDCIYDILGYLRLGLCVDIGAAAGDVTRRIRLAGGADTRVVAFEPFPGNHQFFYHSTRGLDNVVLIKKAVSDSVGQAEFVVPSIVQGTESGWEKFRGYSSVGFLSSGANGPPRVLKGYLKQAIRGIANKLLRRAPSQKIIVATTSIDTEFAGERIDFMKIDVQGGEGKVLLGSDAMLRTKKIGLLYIEWSGNSEVVQRLADRHYWIYDSTYIVGPKTYDVKPFERIGFQLIDEVKLSTGKVAYELLLTHKDVSPSEALSAVKERRLGWIQTDLIAISEDALGPFLEAVKQYEDANRARPLSQSAG